MPDYGNVPLDDVNAMTSAVTSAHEIADLPHTPANWRNLVYETVLDGILSDWVANGTTALSDADKEDIGNLVKVAIDISLSQSAELQDGTFQVLVKNAVKDWVANWNADEED